MSSPAIKLVLLPGMDGTGDLFASFVSVLPDTFETKIARYPTGTFLSYSELAELTRSTIFSSDSYILVAESFSAPLAIQWAAINPPNLKGLVICAGFASSPVPDGLNAIYSFFARILFRVRPSRIATKLLLLGANTPDSLLRSVITAISCVKPEVLAARVRAVLTCDVRAELGSVTVPILYLQPTQDRLVGRSNIEEMLRITPRAFVEEITGPHLLLQSEPQQCANTIVRFACQCHITE